MHNIAASVFFMLYIRSFRKAAAESHKKGYEIETSRQRKLVKYYLSI